MDLTKRQKEIFDYIRRYAPRYGYPPTVREIGKAVGLHSSVDRPRPSRQPGEGGTAAPRPHQAARDRAPGGPGKEASMRRSGLPLVGQVAAGEPVLAEENIEDYLEVPPRSAATMATTSCGSTATR